MVYCTECKRYFHVTFPNDKKLYAKFKGAWVSEYNDLRKTITAD